jgi:hypothetical protein
MSAIAKLREQIAIARDRRTFVVLTVEEAQAVLDDATIPSEATTRCERCGNTATIRFAHARISTPPHEGDDENMPEGVAIKDQIACVARELALRRNVYPKWVAKGRMTAVESEKEIERMSAVLESLKAMNTTKDAR